MTDRQTRWIKTASWSLIAFGITTGVGWIMMGSLLKGGIIGGICRVIKIPTYFLHDLAWDKIKEKAQEPSLDNIGHLTLPEMG